MQQFPIHSRPPYFISKSYNPSFGEAYANWNVYSQFIPDLRRWVYDRLEFHALQELRDSSKKKEILAILKTARKYDQSCINLPVTSTVVTHMYVCELLIKAMLLFFKVTPEKHHGYSFKSKASNPLEYYSSVVNRGIAVNLHNLFYSNPFPSSGDFPSLKEYFRLCPDLRKECYEVLKKSPYVFPCKEGYGSTGSHSVSAHYHSCGISIDVGIMTKSGSSKDRMCKIFPDYSNYNVETGNARYTSSSVEGESKSDNFISTTRGVDGSSYAIGFGESPVIKQRDIEIRFYITFLLGSMARYSPKEWEEMELENPGLFFLVKRFLEVNHVLFPLLVLRYITGKAYSIISRSVLG